MHGALLCGVVTMQLLGEDDAVGPDTPPALCRLIQEVGVCAPLLWHSRSLYICLASHVMHVSRCLARSVRLRSQSFTKCGSTSRWSF